MNMTHDPMQSYATSGYPGVTPFGLPYGALQTPGIQYGFANPFAQTMGISPAYSGYGMHPTQLGITGGQTPWQNPLLTAAAQHPLLYAALQNQILQNPLLQNPVLQHQLLQNPLLQNPFVNPIQAQLQAHAQQLALQAYAAQLGGVSPFGGQGSPYGQIGSQFGQGSPYGQIGSQFGQQPWTQAISPLAPQTWVGQGQSGGFGYGQGQPIQHPLAQLVGRGFQTPGISPWVGF